jgi:NAD(P)-dependent dehydrogenase (short-subunit alcohol dehydrogenase family)
MTVVSVVTGAGSGIGRACAELLAQRGTHVICVGRRPVPLTDTVDAMGGAGEVVSADVSTDEGIAAVVRAVGERNVSALIHGAGRESVTPFTATTRAEFSAVVATNLMGPFFLTRELAPCFGENASVVFVSSMSAESGRDRHAAYGASKAALIGLTRNLAVELAPSVRVNCICPGATVTPMLQEFLADYYGSNPSEELAQTMLADARRLLLGRAADPGEIAATAVHIALDATAMTGSVVTVDLGYTAR